MNDQSSTGQDQRLDLKLWSAKNRITFLAADRVTTEVPQSGRRADGSSGSLQDEINLANFVISDRLASEEIALAYKTQWSTEIVEQLESRLSSS